MLYQINGSMTKQTSTSVKSMISMNDSNKKVKNLLLQGWRNRWTAPEFTTYLKQQLSIVSISGDHYELSKLILQQATVGRQPVVLFIDYLHHLLSCGVISFGSVINSIIETCKKENTQVVICLLDFLISQDNIYCFSNDQDCLNLATSLARLIKFVFTCLEYSLQRLNELNNHQIGNQLNQHEQAIDRCSRLLLMLKNSRLLISLIYVGLIEENETKNSKLINFNDFIDLNDKLITKLSNNKNLSSSFQNVTQFIQTLQKFNPNLQAKKHLQLKASLLNYHKSSNSISNDTFENDESNINETSNELSEYLNRSLVSLNCVVTFDAILNPKAPSTKLANQIYNIAITNHLKFSTICCELIRFSFINFADSLDQDKEQTNMIEIKFLNQFQRRSADSKLTKENVRWASFIYFKLPLVLVSLKELLFNKNDNQTLELERGLEKLINYTPLLELIDFKTDCDCLGNLLNKLKKIDLISETFQSNLMKKKTDKIDYFNNLNGKIEKDVFKKQNENLVMVQGHILLKKAEPTVDSFLLSLNPDIATKPENVIQVFVKVITGNSIEIVLNTLTFNGKLSELIKKIIHFNEINIHASNGESSKQAALRANIFDISFLILFYIVQEHGQEIILNCLEEEGIDLNSERNEMEIDDKSTIEQTQQQNQLANSFFVKFCLDYLPENLSKVNYEDKLTKNIDPNKVEGLMSLFANDSFDYQLIKWNEVLLNVIGVFKEFLCAYLNNYLKFEDLTVYLSNMVKRNCSIALIMAFYAINHMNTVCSDHKKKILSILNYLTNSSNFSSYFNNSTEAFMHYKEKHTLVLKLIRNLMDEQIPKTLLENSQDQSTDQSNDDLKEPEFGNESKQIELYRVLRSSFLSTIKRGWLNASSIYCFNRVLCVSGSKWFMDKLIKLFLYDCEIENLFEGVELIYGLSTLDMEQCCLALLNVVLPQYFVSYNDLSVLIEPKLNALAKLLSSIIFSVLELNKLQSTGSIVRRNSSYFIEDNFIEYENDLINGLTDANSINSINSMNNVLDNQTPAHFIVDSSSIDSLKRKEHLLSSISRLLRLISLFLNEKKISQRISFSLLLLEQLIYTFPCTNCQSNDVSKLVSLGLKNNVQIILQYLPFDTLLNLIRIFPNKINYDLLLSITNLQSTNSRRHACRALCQLTRSKKLSNF